MNPILFADFDGVMHPVGGDVAPLEYAPLLITALEPYPSVRIVLSTSWVAAFGFDDTRAMLPLELQRRVIGATYHSHMKRNMHPKWWVSATRYQQIAHYVQRHAVARWLAIDDDDEGWPAEHRDQLVRTSAYAGLASAVTQAELADKLRSLMS